MKSPENHIFVEYKTLLQTMQSFRFLSWIFLLPGFILLSSCEEEKVRFDQPQPEGVSSDKEIREKFLGDFFCDEDSTWLHIHKDRVWVSNRESEEMPGDGSESGDVEKHQKVQAGATFGKDSSINVKVQVKEENPDSLSVDFGFEEVLLDIGQGDEARFFKGYYFLNKPVEEGMGYKVRILRPTNEGILLCRIQTDSILHLLEKEDFVSKQKNPESEHGEETWNLHPSRRELKKLIKMGLFSNIQLYRKKP